jgi:hypothetical protein
VPAGGFHDLAASSRLTRRAWDLPAAGLSGAEVSQHALKACVLMAIDGRAGEWLSVDQIAHRLGVACERVQAVCTELAEQAMVQQALFNGHPAYGVRVRTRREEKD